MKRYTLIWIFILGFSGLCQAQQIPTITPEQVAGSVCKETTISIPFTANGDFFPAVVGVFPPTTRAKATS